MRAGEESESDTKVSGEDSGRKAKGPSRNARRKRHKRQLKRLGLLKDKPAVTLSSQQKQPPAILPSAVTEKDESTSSAKRKRAEGEAARCEVECACSKDGGLLTLREVSCAE